MVDRAPRRVTYEGILDYIHFSLFSGDFDSSPGVSFLPSCDGANMHDILHFLTSGHSSIPTKVCKSHYAFLPSLFNAMWVVRHSRNSPAVVSDASAGILPVTPVTESKCCQGIEFTLH